MTNYPLISLIVISYKSANFIRETLNSVFAQDYPNLEIIISDDNSPDDTLKIIKRVVAEYQGPHKVFVHQNVPNKGIAGNVWNAFEKYATGEYIIIADGDDIFLPTTVSFAYEHMQAANVCCMGFNEIIINERSEEVRLKDNDWESHIDCIYSIDEYLSNQHKTSGCCRMLKSDIYKKFGPYRSDCQTEDTTNLFRSFLYGQVGYCYKPNIKYRIHGNNISGLHNLMTRFDPVKIYNQYLDDLNTAKKVGLVDSKLYVRILEHLNRYKRINVAIRRIYAKKIFLSRLLSAVLYIFRSDYDFADVRNLVGQVRDWKHYRP